MLVFIYRKILARVVSAIALFCFLFSSGAFYLPPLYAENIPYLPAPNQMIEASKVFEPVTLKGIKFYPDNPFKLSFILDEGTTRLTTEELREEMKRLIKYFLTALTIPAKDLWVNLSPYEEERIIPDVLGLTDVGRDLLGQDYILKQLSSSLTYPESELGRSYWRSVYDKAQKIYGTSKIPIDTYNKIWIVPGATEVYESGTNAVITKDEMKVMTEEDYKALQNNQPLGFKKPDTSFLSARVLRELIIPEIEKDVNSGKNFAYLRQIHSAIVLAGWFKIRLRESIYNNLYIDKSRVKGIKNEDPDIKEKVFSQYVEAFKTGAYNYIKKDVDPLRRSVVSRQYFSGGCDESAAQREKSKGGAVKITAGTLDGLAGHTGENAILTDVDFSPAGPDTPEIPTSGNIDVAKHPVVAPADAQKKPILKASGVKGIISAVVLAMGINGAVAVTPKTATAAPQKKPVAALEASTAKAPSPVAVSAERVELKLPDGSTSYLFSLGVSDRDVPSIDPYMAQALTTPFPNEAMVLRFPDHEGGDYVKDINWGHPAAGVWMEKVSDALRVVLAKNKTTIDAIAKKIEAVRAQLGKTGAVLAVDMNSDQINHFNSIYKSFQERMQLVLQVVENQSGSMNLTGDQKRALGVYLSGHSEMIPLAAAMNDYSVLPLQGLSDEQIKAKKQEAEKNWFITVERARAIVSSLSEMKDGDGVAMRIDEDNTIKFVMDKNIRSALSKWSAYISGDKLSLPAGEKITASMPQKLRDFLNAKAREVSTYIYIAEHGTDTQEKGKSATERLQSILQSGDHPVIVATPGRIKEIIGGVQSVPAADSPTEMPAGASADATILSGTPEELLAAIDSSRLPDGFKEDAVGMVKKAAEKLPRGYFKIEYKVDSRTIDGQKIDTLGGYVVPTVSPSEHRQKVEQFLNDYDVDISALRGSRLDDFYADMYRAHLIGMGYDEDTMETLNTKDENARKLLATSRILQRVKVPAERAKYLALAMGNKGVQGHGVKPSDVVPIDSSRAAEDFDKGGISEEKMKIVVKSDGTAVPMFKDIPIDTKSFEGFTFNITSLQRDMSGAQIFLASAR